MFYMLLLTLCIIVHIKKAKKEESLKNKHHQMFEASILLIQGSFFLIQINCVCVFLLWDYLVCRFHLSDLQ